MLCYFFLFVSLVPLDSLQTCWYQLGWWGIFSPSQSIQCLQMGKEILCPRVQRDILDQVLIVVSFLVRATQPLNVFGFSLGISGLEENQSTSWVSFLLQGILLASASLCLWLRRGVSAPVRNESTSLGHLSLAGLSINLHF